jgi:hypothetical protein
LTAPVQNANNKAMQQNQSSVTDFKPLFKYIDETFATKEDLEILSGKVSGLPTKDEFYEAMDKIMSELATIRQESVVHKLVHEDIDHKFASLGIN